MPQYAGTIIGLKHVYEIGPEIQRGAKCCTVTGMIHNMGSLDNVVSLYTEKEDLLL
jgi:hypothetical protein